MDRRCKIIRNYWPEIKKYCTDNKLSVEKFSGSTMSYSNEAGRLFVLGADPDPEREKLGLADSVPMDIALEILLKNGKLRFEQTEFTRKYLGRTDHTAHPAFKGISRKMRMEAAMSG